MLRRWKTCRSRAYLTNLTYSKPVLAEVSHRNGPLCSSCLLQCINWNNWRMVCVVRLFQKFLLHSSKHSKKSRWVGHSSFSLVTDLLGMQLLSWWLFWTGTQQTQCSNRNHWNIWSPLHRELHWYSEFPSRLKLRFVFLHLDIFRVYTPNT